MKVQINNNMLQETIQILYELTLRGMQSRHRTRFIKMLAERLKEIEDDRIALLEEYANKDDEGIPIKINNGREYDVSDENRVKLGAEIQELMEEPLVIEGGDNKKTLETVYQVLEETDKEFSGREAIVYDYICEQFEANMDLSENKIEEEI